MTERESWTIQAPPGGWASPWPQCIELAAAIPREQWTLVGGLMVQLHAAAAGLPLTRPTSDVDIVLHIETGATTARKMEHALGELGYEVEPSLTRNAVAHRFLRGEQQLDVMIADHPAPSIVTKIAGRMPFKIPGGAQALKRTVNVTIETDTGEATLLSLPNLHGALVLKGAAYLEDSRDRERHLEDAAMLCACLPDPYAIVGELRGSDLKRLGALYGALKDPSHQAWLELDETYRQPAHDALRILATSAQAPGSPPIRRFGSRR